MVSRNMLWQGRVFIMNQRRRNFEQIFKLSSIFGIFPFQRKERFRTSLALVVCSVSILAIYFSTFCVVELRSFIFTLGIKSDRDFLNYSNYCQLVCHFCIPLITPILLWRKLELLDNIFLNLDKLSEITQYRPRVWRMQLLMCVKPLFYYLMCEGSDLRCLFKLYFTCLPIIQVVLIVDQFITIVNLFRHYYIFLTKDITLGNAQLYVRCFETIWKCSSLLMDCYAPQLILFFFSTVLSCVFEIYLFISLYGKSEVKLLFISAVINIIQCFYLIYVCAEAKLEAINFDKKLHRMIIEDDTLILLRNKKITLHFKTKRKESFSVMGFFDFDYPLFCSLVSSVTTYLVILIEFA